MYQRASSSGGGDSNVKSGSFTISAKDTTKTINTGLSTIKRFICFGRTTQISNSHAVVYYDSDNSSRYGGIFCGASVYGKETTINTNPTAYAPWVVSVSGGDITIKSATAADNYASATYYWYAE